MLSPRKHSIRRFRSSLIYVYSIRLSHPVESSIVSRELGNARWVRTPDRKGNWFEIALTGIPSSDVVWLETDNAENAPVELKQMKAMIPTRQLLFQAQQPGALILHYGNPEATPPRYDLSLVAPRVLAARKQEAKIVGVDPVGGSRPAAQTPSSWFSYGVLILVVGGLGVLVTKLVPKPKSA